MSSPVESAKADAAARDKKAGKKAVAASKKEKATEPPAVPPGFEASSEREMPNSMTTLMIKNIPCRCSQQEILDAIEEVGFGQAYNFFYLPMTQGQTHNIGYVFIGFDEDDVAAQFTAAITGFRFKSRNSSKCCEVVPARLQGFQTNMDHFRSRHCVRKRNHPIWRTRL